MVYEKKCTECGKLIDFGGREKDRLPDDAIKFDGKIYCKECVKKFVEFGTGNIKEQIEELEERMDDVAYELGLEWG